MSHIISFEDLKKLFNKAYGENYPSKKIWLKYYQKDVLFIDPTQETYGIDSYIAAQEKLIKRCDDISLETHAICIDGEVGFVEWTMGLKIMGKEFIYPGTTRLIFAKNGLINEHRDYFDFCGSTFGPLPILGPFIRWLYARFIS